MSIDETLLERCQKKCELCSAETEIRAFEVSPSQEGSQEDANRNIMVCRECVEQVRGNSPFNVNHWHCLNETIWSEHTVVKVAAWRILKKLSDESWARDLFEQLYLDEETLNWAQWGEGEDESSAENGAESSGGGDDSPEVRDSNGTLLANGDSVTLIKDLVVKGGGFTAKRGTVVKNIYLTDNPEHIEGKVNGSQIVLVTRFLKKVSS